MPGGFTTRHPKGTVIFEGDGPTIVRDTLQCVHCGRHWVVQPGSGRQRGFCTKCMGPTCGAPDCMECIPQEKRIDMYEKGLRAVL